MITAWQQERLVGLVRGITDQQTILYIQDLLVLKEFQRAGNRANVTKKIVGDYPKIRQKILLTDDTKKNAGFLRSLRVPNSGEKVMRSPFYMPLTKLVKVYLPNKIIGKEVGK